MRSRLSALFVAISLGSLAALALPVTLVAGPKACGVIPYSYAGWEARSPAFGVAAIVTPLQPAVVKQGHVAAWVGVGGPGAGPHGEDEWIQVGMSSFVGAFDANIYYEVARANFAPRYVHVADGITSGSPHRLAVLEMAHRRSWWRVWVDGKPVSQPIFLPGSHGAWAPQAVAESWNGGVQACNRYAYRFDRVLKAGGPGGAWRPLRDGTRLADVGYRVLSSTPADFTVAAT
jgi:hypothetical protein